MKRPDFAVLTGLLIGLTAIGVGAVLEGIRPGFLWRPTAALIVLGGTLGAVLVRRGAEGLWGAARATLALCLRENHDEMKVTMARLSWLTKTARHEGAKALEHHASQSADPLLQRGLMLVAEYAEPATVRAALDRVLDEEHERGLRHAATLEAAGSYAPTFGILGAVLGLIHVLRALADPGALGAGIATAFVATIYGLGLANLIFFPLAARLRERHGAWMRQREALAASIVAMAAHETPRAVAQRFATHLTCDTQTTLTQLRQAAQ
jgi:chemotaxis protein MotA